MPSTPNISITKLIEGQNAAEITVNEAFNRLDSMVHASIVNRTTNTPPAGVEGELYIVGSSPTGVWVGHTDDIAAYYQGWLYFTPKEGWTVFDRLDDVILSWDGTSWITMGRSQRQVGVHVEAPSNTFETVLLYTDRALTVSSIRTVIGAATNVVWSVRYGANRSDAGTLIDTVTTTSTTGQNETVITTATVPANSWVWVEIDSVSGTPSWGELLMTFTID